MRRRAARPDASPDPNGSFADPRLAGYATLANPWRPIVLDVVDVDDAVLNGPGHQRGLGGGGPSQSLVLRPNSLQVGANGRRCDLQLAGNKILAFGTKPRDQHFLSRGARFARPTVLSLSIARAIRGPT